VQCAHLDLASLASVSHFADALPRMHKSGAPPHLLVQNAGVMGVRDSQTEDGFETTFQVNPQFKSDSLNTEP
jgi:NAD(P)-dependent dehydrogenase (short-subunit alcohol dehydrogenase family)